ncbi:MAG TPA: efflux RND transporter periplasmic adaptor subunit [Porticoccaceae bacterium]|nr:efflux RND transporter periplasmic adaptor subunit [Porticoccaceae bacterium]HCO60700.1 efflux RND transporter periplasmic adaptor subunit [Porticoccaceae bacterium]
MKTKPLFFAALSVLVIIAMLFPRPDTEDAGEGQAEQKPLYWVAPMDPNYRRDQPGKSPMGMDLVPVYEDADEQTAGVVWISPDVINNLGVRVMNTKFRVLQSEITTVGYVQYDEDQLVHIHPRVEGWVEKLYVKTAGDPVEKGQPLYELYAPQLVNAQQELVLALKRNNTQLVAAAEDRLKALQIDSSVIDRLKRDRRVSQTLTFYAPQSGVVDNLNIREGFFVNPGTTLMSVGALDTVWVEAEVFERQAALVKVGLPVTMTLDYLPGKQWLGEVDYVYPTLDPKTRTARVRLRFYNPDSLLKPNMFAQVVIHATASEQVLSVPREALIRTGRQDRVVLALGKGRFKSVAVKPGRMDNDYVEIIEGLEADERVVTSAQFLLDSESSKTSDFRRLNHNSNMSDTGEQLPVVDAGRRATVAGTIERVDKKSRRLSISHEPIVKWNRPAMTMDFMASERLDLEAMQVGDDIRFTFEIVGGDFVVVDLRRVPLRDPQQATKDSRHWEHGDD